MANIAKRNLFGEDKAFSVSFYADRRNTNHSLPSSKVKKKLEGCNGKRDGCTKRKREMGKNVPC